MDKQETDSVRRSMLVKWLSIPYSIFVLFCAGASYNLHDRWNFIFEDKGFEKPAHNYTLLVVLFGYYLGAVSGLIIHRLDNRYAYGIASVLAFIGYIGLAIISKVIEAKMLHFVTVDLENLSNFNS